MELWQKWVKPALDGVGAALQELTEWDKLAKPVAAAISILVVLLFLFSAVKSYRLLRLYHAGERRGGRLGVIGRVLGLWLSDPVGIFKRKSLFRRTRARLEFEVLTYRPPFTMGNKEKEAELRDFNQRRRKFAREKSRTIKLPTAHALHERVEEVDRYFHALRRVGVKDEELRFETKLVIENGFVAPLHLVAGILSHFDDDWSRILDSYQEDRTRLGPKEIDSVTREALEKLREIQQFIFLCWLQWGPSIPICNSECDQFGGSWLSLQYGFGDENNSVELVASSNYLDRQWAREDMPLPVGGREAALGRLQGRAKNAVATGHIANSKYLPRTINEMPLIGEALTRSWNHDDEAGRLLMIMETIEKDDPDGEALPTAKTAVVGGIERRKTRAYYYSAYLWANFVTMRLPPTAASLLADRMKAPWIAVHDTENHPRQSRAPWLDFLPFFEHGNIADPETYDYLKRQLAEKVAAGFAKIVLEDAVGEEAAARARAYPLCFAYAGSVDHSGCGHPLRFETARPPLPGSSFPENSLPDLIQREIATKHPLLKDIVRFDIYKKGQCDHSACRIPRDIAAYFNEMESRPEKKTVDAA
jgi:hypothetical protein